MSLREQFEVWLEHYGMSRDPGGKYDEGLTDHMSAAYQAGHAAGRKAALLWAAELVRNYSFFGGLPMFRAHVVAALRAEAEKIK